MFGKGNEPDWVNSIRNDENKENKPWGNVVKNYSCNLLPFHGKYHHSVL
jgi:hypothetical protein